MNNVKRPLLRYFGGKWQMRHWIIEHLPPHEFYAEPFAGAASILLAKEPAPKGEIINDLNGEVVNLFRVMQSKEYGDELMRRLEWTPFAHAEFTAAQTCQTDDPIERARKTLILSFMGIELRGIVESRTGFRMGNVDLARLDQEGKNTFRNCARDWENWKLAAQTIRDRLSNVMIYERDALEFIDLMDAPTCLLYVDPPYAHETRAQTRYAIEFTDHDRLVTRLLACKAMVVLSGYSNVAYEPLEAAGWVREERKSRANMSKEPRTECLWISPNAQKNNTHIEMFGDAPQCGSGITE